MLSLGGKKLKVYIGNSKIKKIYIGSTKLYSSGNIVTYNVDSSLSYTEEVDDEKTCLSPTTFTPSKSGYTFVGWREDNTANSSVLSEKVMGDNPITLYAVFKKDIVITLYNNSSSPTYQTKQQYYNNGNIVNPSFTLTQNSASGWTALGWCTSNGATASVALNNGATITPSSNATYYGKYSQTITVSYNGNGATGGSTASHSGTRYYNSGNYSNPTFTLKSNGFSKKNYAFQKWAQGSAGGTQYSAGANVTLSGNTTFYAVWKQTVFPSNGKITIGTLKFTTTSLPGGSTYVQVTPSFSGFSGGFTASGNQLKANNAMSVSVSITATSENYYQGESVVTGMEATTGIIQIRKNGSSVFSGQYPNDGRSNNSYHNPKTTTRTGSFSVNAGDVLTFWVATTWGTNYWYSEGVCTLSNISGTINGTV